MHSNEIYQDAWRPALPTAAAAWFAPLALSWWVAGGWSLDLYLGRQTRPHSDLDIGIFREDLPAVTLGLAAWEYWQAKDGVHEQLCAGSHARPEVNSVWCRPLGTKNWVFELLLESRQEGDWVFRRDLHIRRPVASIVRRERGGIPCLAPEIQLLYKAKSVRERDQRDFEHVAPTLDADARDWLRQALDHHFLAHPWRPVLDTIGAGTSAAPRDEAAGAS